MASTIQLDCDFAHDQLTRLLKPRIAGHQITEKLTVEDIRLHGDNEWLYAETRMSGSYNGQIEIRYKLDFNPDSGRFILHDLHVELVEKGLFAKGANWVVRKFFAQKLDQRFEHLMNDKFHGLLNDLVKKYSMMTLDNGMQMQSALQEVTFEKISWDERAMYFKAVVRGVFKLTL